MVFKSANQQTLLKNYIFQTNHNILWKFLTGNDVNTEGYFVMEDGTEMTFLSYWWDFLRGADYDAIVLSTYNNGGAGSWVDEYITYNTNYICERDGPSTTA